MDIQLNELLKLVGDMDVATLEGRENAVEVIDYLKTQYYPIISFVLENFGGDLDNVFNTIQDLVIRKTKRALDTYQREGFTREESMQLVLAVQQSFRINIVKK